MTNTSIYAAFERFWQHVVAAIGNHSHAAEDVLYTTSEGEVLTTQEALDQLFALIYVGSTEPTDANTKIWINTSE